MWVLYEAPKHQSTAEQVGGLQSPTLLHLAHNRPSFLLLFFITLELSDMTIYEPSVRALLGTASGFCKAIVLKLRTGTPTGRGASVADAAPPGAQPPGIAPP